MERASSDERKREKKQITDLSTQVVKRIHAIRDRAWEMADDGMEILLVVSTRDVRNGRDYRNMIATTRPDVEEALDHVKKFVTDKPLDFQRFDMREDPEQVDNIRALGVHPFSYENQYPIFPVDYSSSSEGATRRKKNRRQRRRRRQRTSVLHQEAAPVPPMRVQKRGAVLVTKKNNRRNTFSMTASEKVAALIADHSSEAYE